MPAEIRPLRLLILVLVVTACWLCPPPAGLEVAGWQTFGVFVAVLAGFLLRPAPMAPIILGALLLLAISGVQPIGTLTENGFGNKTVWLVTSAFLLAGAVARTGLGRRIALLLVRSLGRTLLGLGYAIAGTELILAPFVPSNTARGGGIVAPVVQGLADTLSDPNGACHRYLVQVGAHANLLTSSMFLTAMAGNTALVEPVLAEFGVDWTFGLWLAGSIVPGLVGLALVPLVVRLVEPRVPRRVDGARELAQSEIEGLGPWSSGEIRLGCILLVLLALWVGGKALSIALLGQPTLSTHTVALLGVVALVLTGTQTWRQILETRHAWDALIWLGGFVALAKALQATGFVAWFGGEVEALLGEGHPVGLLIVLALVYFFTMYFFSQLTAHIAALGTLFLGLAHGLGSPPMLSIALISYFSCLCGLTTPWSSGPVIIYFGFGHVTVGRWMRNGLVQAIVQIVVWLSVGLAWWKLLGWW